jgi:RNA polymerase sigma-70 factor (ECF subfamily)
MCIVKNEDLANDLFQETFLKVITKLQRRQYADTGKFSCWLNRITHNVVMDYYRSQKNDKVIDAPKENDLSNIKSADLVGGNREIELTNDQTMKDLLFLMDHLPEHQRTVLFMRYFQNLSFKEIAEETNVSVNTSLGRMRYALINMRRLSREYEINLSLE